MSKIKAVFFDRDETLTYPNQETHKKLYDLVESVSHKPLEMNRKKMFDLFGRIKERGFNTSTYENEVEFYKEYYRELLREECGYCDEFNDHCPVCGSTHIQQLRRVTGYLTGDYTSAFNEGKIAEVQERVKHK